MKDHEIAQVINQLKDIAIEYRDAQQLRQQIHGVVMDMVKRLREDKSFGMSIDISSDQKSIDISLTKK